MDRPIIQRRSVVLPNDGPSTQQGSSRAARSTFPNIPQRGGCERHDEPSTSNEGQADWTELARVAPRFERRRVGTTAVEGKPDGTGACCARSG